MKRIEITSRSNPRLKDLLAEKKRWCFFEGEKLVRDVLDRGPRVDKLLVSTALEAAPSMGRAEVDEFWLVNPQVMEKISGLKNPPLLIAVLAPPRTEIDFNRRGLVIGLVDVQDPGNVGTVFRCASAFGIQALALAGGCARPSHPKVVRAAQTALLDVPFQVFPGTDELVARALAGEARVYVTGSHPVHPPLPLETLEFPCLLLFGSEGRGLDPRLLERFPHVRLEQKERMDSLNVGISACILMHELQRMYTL